MYAQNLQLLVLLLVGLCFNLPSRAANFNVNVGNNFFSPASITINVNDQVTWTWTVNSTHNVTGPGNPPLWNSGNRSSGTYSRVFTTAGTFNYRCTLHGGMNGTVTVQGGNTPPTVTITDPANNAVLIAPATFNINANASDPGGSVSQVEFFQGATSLGVDTTSPYSAGVTNLAAGTYAISAVASDNLAARATNTITLIVNARPTVALNAPANGSIFAAPATLTIEAGASDSDGSVSQVQFYTNSVLRSVDTTVPYQATAANLAAGTYNLLAVATDNRNATATSSVATISVVNPVAIVLSAPQRLSSTQFQFRYTANAGLRYVVECSPILTNWMRVATNIPSIGSVTFIGPINTNRNFYRVGRLPNP